MLLCMASFNGFAPSFKTILLQPLALLDCIINTSPAANKHPKPVHLSTHPTATETDITAQWFLLQLMLLLSWCHQLDVLCSATPSSIIQSKPAVQKSSCFLRLRLQLHMNCSPTSPRNILTLYKGSSRESNWRQCDSVWLNRGQRVCISGKNSDAK